MIVCSGRGEMLLHRIKLFAVVLCAIAIVATAATAFSQDNSDQVSAWKQAAINGDPAAALELADTYRQGWGVEKNEDEAFKWYLKAANEGDPNAEFIVARAYATGHGLKQDNSEALNWYRKAALLGNAAAQNSLGEAYFYGRGVDADRATALSWYQKAADQGNPDAEYNLGEAYHHGAGVAKNDKLAEMLYQKAMAKGNELASKRLIEIEGAPQQSIFDVLKNSTQLQLILVVVLLGSIFFIIEIRKQGRERYQLNFFVSKQFGLLVSGAIFFYVTHKFTGSCDSSDMNFCQSSSNVEIGISLLTIIFASIMNIKQSNPVFGSFYTLAQFVTAYTFIPAVLVEIIGEIRRSYTKKKIRQSAKGDGNAVF